jgi:predicted nucleic acid-binding protein
LRFWDSSAVVPLLVDEPATDAVRAALEEDPTMLVWWGTELECVSAIARLERQGDLASDATVVALQRLEALAGGWHELQPVESVRRAARRALRVHSLRTADALQLAAATIGSEGQPASLDVISLDDRLNDAARREGFAVLELIADPP